MEIQDIGLPSWTLQLPGGMVLKMGSAQGVLVIPDEDADAVEPRRALAVAKRVNSELGKEIESQAREIRSLTTERDEARRTIRSLTANLVEHEIPTVVEFDPTTDTIPDQVPDLATEAVEAEAATDRDEIIDADDLPPGHYDR